MSNYIDRILSAFSDIWLIYLQLIKDDLGFLIKGFVHQKSI